MRKLFIVLLIAVGSSLFATGCDSSSAQGVETLRLLLRADGDEGSFIWTTTLSPADGEAFFFAGDSAFGAEPWISDGTPEGTRLLKDIMPGPADSTQTPLFEDAFVEFNGLVYFAANDGVSGLELWRTDGTEAGTELALDLNPGSEGFTGMLLRSSGNRLYVTTWDNARFSEVWVLEAPN